MKTYGTEPHLDFSDGLWSAIKGMLEVLADRHKQRRIAAFDADGTLWDFDLGEAFFNFQILNCGLKLPPDPWEHYSNWKATDPKAAYLWLAQINSGQSIEQVQQWARDCFKSQTPAPYFRSVLKLIEYLKVLNFEIYVVTASVKWAVVPGAEALGIPADRVLGIRTKVKDGIVTHEQEGEITWNEGKSKELLLRTGGEQPLLCVGNTMGDLALLECSQGACLAVASQNATDELKETENRLQAKARQMGWFRHTF